MNSRRSASAPNVDRALCRCRAMPHAGPASSAPTSRAQAGQRGHRIDALGQERRGPGQRRDALRRRQGPQLAHRLRSLLSGVLVHRDSLAYGLVGATVTRPGTRLSGWHSRG